MERVLDRSLLIGMGLIAILLVSGATLGYGNTRRLAEDAASVAHTHEVLDQTSGVLRLLVDAESAERGFLITGKEEYLQPYDAAAKRLDGEMATLQKNTADDPVQQQHLERLKQMTGARLSLLEEAIALRRNDPDNARLHVLIAKGKAQMDAIQDLGGEMERTEHDLLQERRRRSHLAYVVAQISVLLTAASGLLMVGAFYWLLRRGLLARQKAAALVQQEREWLRTTLASIGDAVVATDAGGRVTLLNPVAQTLTGWAEAEAIGRPLEDVFRIVNDKTRQPVENPALRAMKEGVVVGLANHTILVSQDGVDRPIDDSAAPIRDERGQVAGSVLVFRDVTERRRAEEELLSSREQLSERAEQLADADRRKNEFLAMLAHELRNPLAPIRNAVQLLHRDGPPEPRLRQLRDMIDRQVRHLVRLVDDLLDVSRISRGKLELRKERVRLEAVVDSAMETSRPLIDAGNHELSIVVPPESPVVEGDLVRLAQVVANLLNNSAKYTPAGGHILLTVQAVQGQAVIRVWDDGAGIPRHMLARVFDLFAQVDARVERAQGGLGIGLTLVKQLVEMHGGTVEAHSEGEGKGSEVVVRLPLAAEAPELEQPAVTRGDEQEMKGPRRRILVVDDNQDGADSLGELLVTFGHEVQIVYDGASALEIAGALRPDVVLLDIGLPGMSGYDVARRMRQTPELGGVVLVARTGWGQEEDRRKTQEAGFNAHLVKPVDTAALRRLLATLEPGGLTLSAGGVTSLSGGVRSSSAAPSRPAT